MFSSTTTSSSVSFICKDEGSTQGEGVDEVQCRAFFTASYCEWYGPPLLTWWISPAQASSHPVLQPLPSSGFHGKSFFLLFFYSVLFLAHASSHFDRALWSSQWPYSRVVLTRPAALHQKCRAHCQSPSYKMQNWHWSGHRPQHRAIQYPLSLLIIW